MNFVSQVGEWLTNASNWRGQTGILHELAVHLELSAIAVGIACAIAIPVGLWIGHTGRGGTLAINISNVGRAVPTYALLVLLFVAVGVFHRRLETEIALVSFAVPPLLTNTYVGVREVDQQVVEAARGMGMSPWQLLARVELPLAVPLIADGLRIAVVQVIATTTVASLIGVDGLGGFVTEGFNNSNPGEYGGAAVLIGALALLAELVFWALVRWLDPTRRGERSRRAEAFRATR